MNQPLSHANRDYGRDFSHAQPRERLRLVPNDGQAPKKPAFEAKGHDRQLQDAQFSASTITLTTLDGLQYEGTIARRDRYSITLRIEGGERVFFKHALKSFEVRPAQA